MTQTWTQSPTSNLSSPSETFISRMGRRYFFSAGHKCSRPELSVYENQNLYQHDPQADGYGHNYILEVTVEGPLDENGIVMNLWDLDKILKQKIEPLDKCFLNTDVEHFQTQVPTVENLALFLFQEIDSSLKRDYPFVRLSLVRVIESEDIWADCIRNTQVFPPHPKESDLKEKDCSTAKSLCP